jgi:hypothetical protein
MAASVRTRVVSWSEAAEMNESVLSDALVMPSSSGRPDAGFLSAFTSASLLRMKRNLSITSMCLSLVVLVAAFADRRCVSGGAEAVRLEA